MEGPIGIPGILNGAQVAWARSRQPLAAPAPVPAETGGKPALGEGTAPADGKSAGADLVDQYVKEAYLDYLEGRRERPPTPAEINQMREEIRRAREQRHPPEPSAEDRRNEELRRQHEGYLRD